VKKQFLRYVYKLSYSSKLIGGTDFAVVSHNDFITTPRVQTVINLQTDYVTHLDMLTDGEDFNFAEIHCIIDQRKLHNDVSET